MFENRRCSSTVRDAVRVYRWALGNAESSRTNADDRLSLDPLGSVEGGNSIVEGQPRCRFCLHMPMPVIQRVHRQLLRTGQITYCGLLVVAHRTGQAGYGLLVDIYMSMLYALMHENYDSAF